MMKKCYLCKTEMKLKQVEVETRLITYMADRWVCNNPMCSKSATYIQEYDRKIRDEIRR